MFTVPVGSMLWGANMHEPVVVALSCPLLYSRQWQVQDTHHVAELKDHVSGVEFGLGWERVGLQKFWMEAGKWAGV